MTLPASGAISASAINTELGRAASAAFSMNGSAERGLAGVPSGAIAMSNFYGKSNGIVTTVTIVAGVVTLSYGYFRSNAGTATPDQVTTKRGLVNITSTMTSSQYAGTDFYLNFEGAADIADLISLRLESINDGTFTPRTYNTTDPEHSLFGVTHSWIFTGQGAAMAASRMDNGFSYRAIYTFAA